jgi:acyl-CoA synthetase (AMP-forming)/AMP-acid ligase II/outer membrane protein assembly factor BamB/acyl carrier protein
MRLRRPFVPVSCMEQHRPGRMNNVVNLLLEKGKRYLYNDYENNNNNSSSNISSSGSHHLPSVVAVTVCENDQDPILSVFQDAGVHRIIYLDPTGMIREQLSVPETLPSFTLPRKISTFKSSREEEKDDDMYIMFTSGTTSGLSSHPKAVVGSHRATYKRLRWFLNTFSSSPRVGRRTKLTFVDGVSELWGALLDPNNVLVSVTPIELRAKGVITLVEDMKCTQLLLLPSQVSQLLLVSSEKVASHNLERVILSGEVCSTMIWEKFQTVYPKTQLINLYGQTETTGDVLYAIISELGDAAVVDNVVAVGKPIMKGIQISLLDDDNSNENYDPSDKQKQQQIGNKQLIIKGKEQKLSNGYLGCSSSFDEFIPGDVGFYQNNIWYVRGRVDDVRKINGVLTSPNEIEAAFCKTYDINDYAGIAAVVFNNQVFLISTNRDAVQRFSRLHMHEAGIPLNLIPKKVLHVPSIPRIASGANKIDRKACLKLVQYNDHPDNPKKKTETTLYSIVANVLGMDECDLDSNRSFLELGGDSATSITLLYRLKEEARIISDINATDILWSESLQELENMLMGECGKAKRRRKETKTGLSIKPATFREFLPKESVQVDECHRSISLLACVDSTPLVMGNSIVSACQGGAILKFSTIDGTLEGFRHYPGWMIQADLLLIDSTNTLLVCGYSSTDKGVVVCLTSDLQEEKWKAELDGAIKSRPVVIDGVVWVLVGGRSVGLDSTTGQALNNELQLPRIPCVGNHIVINGEDGHGSIAFAISDWEGGIILLDTQKLESKIFVDCEIGPVYKDMTITEDSKGLFISDIYGSLHHLNIKTMKILASIQLSSNPLSTATIIDNNTVVVGSYNGVLYCVRYDEGQQQLEKQWECNCFSSIYSKPHVLRDGSIVVCTTAGYFIKIFVDNGDIQSFNRISAEIWSSPVQVGENVVAVGARDSKCHLMTL